MVSQIVSCNVTPAQAGVQNLLKALDSGLRRNDGNWQFQTFCEIVKLDESYKLKGTYHMNGWFSVSICPSRSPRHPTSQSMHTSRNKDVRQGSQFKNEPWKNAT
jgi:hypothetical protein